MPISSRCALDTARQTLDVKRAMLPQLHQHILAAMDRSARADTVFVFGAVVLDVVSIGVNSALADSRSLTANLVFWIFLVGVVLVTAIAAAALRNGTSEALAYHEALMNLYAKEGVADYVPRAGLVRGNARHHLYFALVVLLGGLAIVVPLLVKFGA